MSPANAAQASEQLRRLLLAIPALADGKPHAIEEIAERAGTDPLTVGTDLRTLVDRDGPEPGGFIESVQLTFDAKRVQLISRDFRRPMGLTASELHAIELGLAVIQREVPPEETRLVEAARERLRLAATELPDDDGAEAERAATLGAMAPTPLHLAALRGAIVRGRRALVRYQAANATEVSDRTVHPFGLVWAGGRWYLVAFCDTNNAMRVFRVDRLVTVGVLEDQPAVIPEGFALEDVLREGRVLASDGHEALRVSYSANIARWIAERPGAERQVDGSVVVEHPLLDDDWAVRHVLQYGPDAVVMSPERVRVAVRARLEAMSASDGRQ